MRIPHLFVIFLLFGLLCGQAMGDASAERHGLIVASVGTVRFAGELEPAYPGDIPIGSLYEVRISNVQVLRGSFPKGVRSVTLAATHEGVLKRNERISIFVRETANGLEVVHWDRLFVATCVPNGYWLESELADQASYEESASIRRPARSCILVDK